MNNELVWELPNVFSDDFCEEIIKKFNTDFRKHTGVTLGGANSSIKETTDLHITSFLDWKKYDNVIKEKVSECITKYYKEYYQQYCIGVSELYDEGYLISKTIPESVGYKWHHDFYIKPNADYRFLAIIIYLNTIDNSGETEFLYGRKIKPESGKVLIFPATWTYNHRGNPPVDCDKYIITTFIYHKYESGIVK